MKQEDDANSAPADANTEMPQPKGKEAFEQFESSALLDSLGCLVVGFMENYLQKLLDIRDKITSLSLDTIAFSDLWQLFKPGTTVVQNTGSMRYGNPQAYRIFHVEGPFNQVPSHIPYETMNLHCYSLAFDGVTFRPGQSSFRIHPYQGLRNIRNLSVLPVSFVAELESKLQARGRNFLGHRYGHRQYTGLTNTLCATDTPYMSRTNAITLMPEEYIDDEVFVDFKMGLQYCPPFRDYLDSVYPNKSPWFSHDKPSARPVLKDACWRCQRQFFSEHIQNFILSDNFCHDFRPPTWTEGQSAVESDNGQEMLLPPCVIAMRLSSQRLCRLLGFQTDSSFTDNSHFPDVLSVGLIAHIEPGPSRSTLNNLVIPVDHRAVLEAVVNFCGPIDDNSSSGSVTAKVASDASQGLIVLLHGPPGSGKVCTVSNICPPFVPHWCLGS